METIYFPTISDEDFSFAGILVEACFPRGIFYSHSHSCSGSWLFRKLFFKRNKELIESYNNACNKLNYYLSLEQKELDKSLKTIAENKEKKEACLKFLEDTKCVFLRISEIMGDDDLIEKFNNVIDKRFNIILNNPTLRNEREKMLHDLYNEVYKLEWIDKETKLNDFIWVFSGGHSNHKPKNFKPIKWIKLGKNKQVNKASLIFFCRAVFNFSDEEIDKDFFDWAKDKFDIGVELNYNNKRFGEIPKEISDIIILK